MIDGDDDEMGLVNDPADSLNPILKNKLEEFNFGEAQINKFLSEPDREKVLDCVDYVVMRLEKGANIKDLTAYLNTILEMHREGGLDISAVEDWRTQQQQKQAQLNQQIQDQTQQEIEEAQDKIKQEKDKKLIEEFKESSSEVFEKICMDYLEELEKKNKIIFNRVLKKSNELNQTLIETVKDYSMTSSEIDLRILEKIETVNS
jgi:DNA anti-recombination protein RmuC